MSQAFYSKWKLLYEAIPVRPRRRWCGVSCHCDTHTYVCMCEVETKRRLNYNIGDDKDNENDTTTARASRAEGAANNSDTIHKGLKAPQSKVAAQVSPKVLAHRRKDNAIGR